MLRVTVPGSSTLTTVTVRPADAVTVSEYSVLASWLTSLPSVRVIYPVLELTSKRPMSGPDMEYVTVRGAAAACRGVPTEVPAGEFSGRSMKVPAAWPLAVTDSSIDGAASTVSRSFMIGVTQLWISPPP